MADGQHREHIHIPGEELVERVKELIHEGNVTHIRISHEMHPVLEIPVTVGVIGLVLVPILAAVAAAGAVMTNCTIEIIRTEPPPSD